MSVPEAVRVIQQALERGNFGRADLLCRHMMEALPDFAWSPLLLAETARRIGELDTGRYWLGQAAQMAAGRALEPEFDRELRRIQGALERTPLPPRRTGWLLIKCWGYGFWSDVEHVLASLLLAEMTNRTPIVHWGQNSYYIDEGTEEAFGTLFDAIAPLSLAELAAEEGAIYPAKYRRDNLDAVGLNIWDGPYSRLSGIYLLNRPERIVVADFFTQVLELLPWLRADHWLHGASPMEAIRLLYEKYLVPAPDIRARIEDFTVQNFARRPVLGVHIRNLDKGSEDPTLHETNRGILTLVDRYLAQVADLRLFLLTDSDQIIEAYTERYGDRVFHIDCSRTTGLVPLTWRQSDNRRELGAEVIMDTYLAAACDYFIGHGGSNVACMVACLKRWPDGTLHLLDDNAKTRRNWLLHDW